MSKINVKAEKLSAKSALSQKIEDYKLLVKFRLTVTVVFSSVMAFILASSGPADWIGVFILALGGFLVTGAANALNEVLEKDYDAKMERTKVRPLPTGRMNSSQAVLIAGFMSLSGTALLALFNTWAAFFGMLALVSYAFVYTPLKRVSPMAITVGAIPGAMPMLIGAVAIEGDLTSFALLLFGLQFFWQFPHFWAIGWLGFEDYKKAGFNLIPENNGEKDAKIGLHSFIYALCLIPVGIGFFMLGKLSLVATVLVGLLSLVYALFGLQLYRKNNQKTALSLMFSSFAYLPLVLIIMWIDKLIF